MTKKEIAQVLTDMREQSGKTREEVADILGKSIKTIGHWETGYAQPDANTLFLLCTIYGTDINTAFGFETKKSAPSLSPEALDIAIQFDALDARDQALIRSMMDSMKKNNTVSDVETA